MIVPGTCGQGTDRRCLLHALIGTSTEHYRSLKEELSSQQGWVQEVFLEEVTVKQCPKGCFTTGLLSISTERVPNVWPH